MDSNDRTLDDSDYGILLNMSLLKLPIHIQMTPFDNVTMNLLCRWCWHQCKQSEEQRRKEKSEIYLWTEHYIPTNQ